MSISHFYDDVKVRSTDAPPLHDPLFLNKHSINNNYYILFKFRIEIVSIMDKIDEVFICLSIYLHKVISDVHEL